MYRSPSRYRQDRKQKPSCKKGKLCGDVCIPKDAECKEKGGGKSTKTRNKKKAIAAGLGVAALAGIAGLGYAATSGRGKSSDGGSPSGSSSTRSKPKSSNGGGLPPGSSSTQENPLGSSVREKVRGLRSSFSSAKKKKESPPPPPPPSAKKKKESPPPPPPPSAKKKKESPPPPPPNREERFKDEPPRSESWSGTLGVKPNATEGEVKTRYKELLKKFHPDRFADASPEEQKRANEVSQRLGEAFLKFKKGKKRRWDSISKNPYEQGFYSAASY